jgi:hypothetical protein
MTRRCGREEEKVHIQLREFQEAIREVEQWSLGWGFKFSVEKTQTGFPTRRNVWAEV